MEKFLRFRDRNYNEVHYPLSSLLGFSRQDPSCGSCLYIHFKPLRVTTQADGVGDFDTDHVKIKFTDMSVHARAVINLLTNISAGSGVIDVMVINGDSLQFHAFDLKNNNISQYFCNPNGNESCNTTTWVDFVAIHMVES